MSKQLCIVHANCQGEPLIERLMTCPEFAEQYECRLFTNYIKEPIPDELMQKCSLFLYQYLGENWNELASANLLAKLPDSARHLCIPNMFFKGYWPMWSGEAGFNYRCTHLDSYIDMELPADQTLMLFLRSDVEKKYDLLTMVAQTIEQERAREKHTSIKYVDFLVEKYRGQRLFNTVNHPGPLLMNHAAVGVLDSLGFASPSAETLDALGDPFPEFEQPINPKIGDFFGWEFATANTEYNVYGRKLTYARYVANYVSAREKNITDFIGYLQGDYIEL